MSIEINFYLQFGVMFVLAACLGTWYVWPRLKGLSFYSAAVPLLSVAVVRILGLNFLNPNVTVNTPAVLANTAAYGDLVSALLALLALLAVKNRHSLAVFLCWAYVVFGGLELIYVFLLGIQYDMPLHAGAFGLIIILNLPNVILSLVFLVMALLKKPKN